MSEMLSQAKVSTVRATSGAGRLLKMFFGDKFPVRFETKLTFLARKWSRCAAAMRFCLVPERTVLKASLLRELRQETFYSQ